MLVAHLIAGWRVRVQAAKQQRHQSTRNNVLVISKRNILFYFGSDPRRPRFTRFDESIAAPTDCRTEAPKSASHRINSRNITSFSLCHVRPRRRCGATSEFARFKCTLHFLHPLQTDTLSSAPLVLHIRCPPHTCIAAALVAHAVQWHVGHVAQLAHELRQRRLALGFQVCSTNQSKWSTIHHETSHQSPCISRQTSVELCVEQRLEVAEVVCEDAVLPEPMLVPLDDAGVHRLQCTVDPHPTPAAHVLHAVPAVQAHRVRLARGRIGAQKRAVRQ